MNTYFISDLHLSDSEPKLSAAFDNFLTDTLQPSDHLYILGDFFDMWIGDDDDASLAKATQARLKQATDSGVTGYFIRGNRDFLLGRDYLDECGFTLLEDHITLELAGVRTLIMHGDTLCTDDKEYQQFRQQVRSPAWQSQVLGLPVEHRRAMAQQLRDQSQSMSAIKASDIMDVNQDEVENVMSCAAATVLIHGHTHRPDTHDLIVNDRQCQRIVLGAWHDQGWYLKVSAHQQRPVYDLVSFELAA